LGHTIIARKRELHPDIIVDRLQREFGVVANIGKPMASYRETTKKSLAQEGKFVRQTAGKGKFVHVYVRLEPLAEDAGKDYEFVEEVVGGVVPKEFFGAVDKGIQERMKNGVLAGYPVVGIKATLFDGSYHDVDS